ncbi:MAG: TIM barrel protein [Bryobacterales bacterium]|nr:TIM barrel protein [Bryobacterales bacterium]
MKRMMVHRREFFRRTLWGGAAMSCGAWMDFVAAQAAPGAAGESASRVGAQVYVFTQHHQRRGERLRDHLPAMLQANADAGIRQLELIGDLVTPDLQPGLVNASKALGIRFPIVYTGAKLYDRGEQAAAISSAVIVARNAAAAGARFLDCNPNPKPQKARKTDDELAVEAEGIRKLASAVRAEGLTLLLHQHDAEMLEGARNWRYWLQHTDAKDVRICLDTHWAHRAGQDALAILRECRPRLESVHLRNSRRGAWWECLDDGDLDYRPIAGYLRETSFQGYLMVELAWEKDTRHTRNLTDNLRLSRQYTERRFLPAGA